MIPFLVVDRPASLRIIQGARLPGVIGLMSHANTSENFQKLFRDYPCGEKACHAIDPSGKTNCAVNFDASQCEIAQRIRQQTVKICDCGMFTKDGVQFDYPELFSIYDRMGTDYGIMLDVFQDANATIESAQEALQIYAEGNYNFNLVLVAQGTTEDEYLRCYEQLLEMGGQYIAVGGLLQKKAGTARYVSVRDETSMEKILRRIREEHNPGWLFALGCYHPNRHTLFEDLGVWGSDYKGWIFQYKKRERIIQQHWEQIQEALMEYAGHKLVNEFKNQVSTRHKLLLMHEKSEYNARRSREDADNRPETLDRKDGELLLSLIHIQNRIYLNGTTPRIDDDLRQIENAILKSEMELRYEQVRIMLEQLEL